MPRTNSQKCRGACSASLVMRWVATPMKPSHAIQLQEKQYGAALALAAEIIEHGVREHPELGIGSTAKGQTNVRRIPNSPTLQVDNTTCCSRLARSSSHELATCRHLHSECCSFHTGIYRACLCPTNIIQNHKTPFHAAQRSACSSSTCF